MFCKDSVVYFQRLWQIGARDSRVFAPCSFFQYSCSESGGCRRVTSPRETVVALLLVLREVDHIAGLPILRVGKAEVA
jgi:hypothetical protein